MHNCINSYKRVPFCTPPHEQVSHGLISRSAIVRKIVLEEEKEGGKRL